MLVDAVEKVLDTQHQQERIIIQLAKEEGCAGSFVRLDEGECCNLM